MIDDRLQQLIGKESRKTHTFSVLLGVQSSDGRVDFQGAAGEASPDSPYFIASVTKMVTGAVLMELVDDGKLDLDAPITRYLPRDLISRIHVHKGTDYSEQLKIYQLIHQTSGLPDYFEGQLAEDFKMNRERTYSVEDTVEIARKGSPAAAITLFGYQLPTSRQDD